MTKEQALNTIQNIYDCNGYRETDGNNWLGARLYALEQFIKHPNLECYCSSLASGKCDACTGIR